MGVQRRDRVTRSVNYFARLALPKKRKKRLRNEIKNSTSVKLIPTALRRNSVLVTATHILYILYV